MGENATVTGPIINWIDWEALGISNHILLGMGKGALDDYAFVVPLFVDRALIPSDRYKGKTISVTGTITAKPFPFEGANIKVTDLSQIVVEAAPLPDASLQTKILVEGLVYVACPRWHNDKLWISDVYARQVMTVDLTGKTEIIVKVPGQPAGLGWLPDGRLLVVDMTNKRLLRLDPEGLTEAADLSGLASGNWTSMVVDSLGRAYIGNFGLTVINKGSFKIGEAELVLVTPDGKAQVVATNMVIPNGMVVTPNGRTLIVAETFRSRLTAFTIQSDGSLTERRTWANFDTGFYPAGICLDVQGGIWAANSGGNEVFRVLEGGEITHKVQVSTIPYACALGGTDGRTLFILTAESNLPGVPDEANAKGNGRIETIRVDVPGV